MNTLNNNRIVKEYTSLGRAWEGTRGAKASAHSRAQLFGRQRVNFLVKDWPLTDF